MKERLKGIAGATAMARRFGRFRFLLKAQQVRAEGAGFRRDPLNSLRYMLFDPETHSYSFELGNVDDLCGFLEDVTGSPRSVIGGYVAEALADPELTTRLRRRVRWRLDVKRDMPLGNRLLWYALVRAVKPHFVVETGIFQGLGSLMLLRALERNAAEGEDGHLLSIDFDPDSGWLVPEDQRRRWTTVFGDIEADLVPALASRPIGVFIHESDHNEALQRFEFQTALDHAAQRLYVIDSAGRELPVLTELCQQRGAAHHLFVERPKRHFYRPPGTAVAVFDRAAESSA